MENSKNISWEIKVPLLTNTAILTDMLKGFGLTYIIVVLLMGFIFLLQGETEGFLQIVWMFALIVGGLMVLSALIMLIVFRNSYHIRYTLDSEGATFETLDRRVKMANRVAIGAGFLGGGQAAGAGLLARSQETIYVPWKNVNQVLYNEKRGRITLRNTWRNVMIIFTGRGSWQEAANAVRENVKEASAKKPARKGNALVKMLLTTVFVVACVAATFAVPFETELFVKIFVLCFALATIWLSRLMAYPVLLGLAYMIYEILVQGFEVSTWTLINTYTLTGFGFLSGDEWAALVLGFLGIAGLATYCILSLTGRTSSALEGDEAGEN